MPMNQHDRDDRTDRLESPLGLIAMGSGAGSSLEGSEMDRELDEVARCLDVERPRAEPHRDAAD